MKSAFHPTMKAPDDPVPSGDREMARRLCEALRLAQHEVEVVSGLRSYFKTPDAGRLAHLREAASAEAARLIAANGERTSASASVAASLADAEVRSPFDIWFTYHVYHKSPDLLGPAVARTLGIPYVIAEATWAGKRSRDAWAPWQREAEAAFRSADAIFAMTAQDRAGLADMPGLATPIVDLPPFLDIAAFPPAKPRTATGPAHLIAIAMMRQDAKLASYRFLAQSLRLLAAPDWTLTIAGDGPARADVEAAFAGFAPGRITFAGQIDRAAVIAEFAKADLFVWPGLSEAYGMVYLEAQAAGVPVVALDSGGVSSTFAPGRTGLLVASQTPASYAAAIAELLRDHERRLAMGRAARHLIETRHSLAGAAAILGDALARIRKS